MVFFISEKKTKFEFGLFLLWIWIFSEENCFWYISEVFSSEKIQIHKRKRPNSNLVFFSEIKKKQIWKFGFFFPEKKNPNLKKKKNQEKNLVNSNLVFFTWTDLLTVCPYPTTYLLEFCKMPSRALAHYFEKRNNLPNGNKTFPHIHFLGQE